MCKIGVRYVQTMLLFSNAAVLYMNRFHLAVTILAMTKDDVNESKEFMIFKWNGMQKSVILSSFYWGYGLGQIPSGFLVRRYKVKVMLFFCTFLTGIFTLLVPFWVPTGGFKIFCMLRALQGLFQGCHYPALQQHLANWSPVNERGLLSTLVNTGYFFGMAIAMLSGGLIAVSPLGWPGTFYISAALSFLWCLIWLLLSANNFKASKFITITESHYIETSLKTSIDFGTKTLPTPWCAILRCTPFWSVLIARSTSTFGANTIVYYMPTYMNSIFKLKLQNNAFYSTLPYLCQIVASLIILYLGECLLKRKVLSLTAQRKLFNSLGIWLPAALTLWLGFVNDHHQLLAIVLFIILLSISTAIALGSYVNVIDLAPNHVAALITIINTAINISLMCGPLFYGLIVQDEENRFQWRVVFGVLAVILCAGDIVFRIWSTAEEQPWNLVKIEEANEVNKYCNKDDLKLKEHVNPVFVED